MKRPLNFLWLLLLSSPFLVLRSSLLAGSLDGKIIMLDPGHGVKNQAGEIINTGQVGPTGLQERDVVLTISEILAQKLRATGAVVHATRTKENPWRLAESAEEDNLDRATSANEVSADAFVRLHLDWLIRRRHVPHGTTVYYYTEMSEPLAKTVLVELVRSTRRHNRGVKKDYFVGMILPQMPTVLVEAAYISHPQEEKLLRSPEFLSKIAEGIFRGLEKYFKKQ